MQHSNYRIAAQIPLQQAAARPSERGPTCDKLQVPHLKAETAAICIRFRKGRSSAISDG
jgi:hypothetical protein